MRKPFQKSLGRVPSQLLGQNCHWGGNFSVTGQGLISSHSLGLRRTKTSQSTRPFGGRKNWKEMWGFCQEGRSVSYIPSPKSLCDSRLSQSRLLLMQVLLFRTHTINLYARDCAGPSSHLESKSYSQDLDQEPTIQWRYFLHNELPLCVQSKPVNPYHALLIGLYHLRAVPLFRWVVNSLRSGTMSKLSYSIWIFHVFMVANHKDGA